MLDWRPLPANDGRPPRATGDQWRLLVPVPDGAPPPPSAHPTRGIPSETWPYRDTESAILGYVWRFDLPDGSKEFTPLTFWQHPKKGQAWRFKSWPPPRPLYGLDRLAARPEAPVVICEGEKAADAAQALLPSWIAVSAPGGSNSVRQADCDPLRGRRVVIWRDADKAGRKYAESFLTMLTGLASSIAVARPPRDVKAGWDAADALAEDWDAERTATWLEAAEPADGWMRSRAAGSSHRSEREERHDNRRSRRADPPQRDRLVTLGAEAELWHTPEREPFATMEVDAHQENWPIRSKDFRRWLAGVHYDACGGAAGGQVLEDAIRVLEMKALRGPEHPVFLRVGGTVGAVYFDLADKDWRAVEITRQGWRLVSRPPVKFLRTGAMQALPEPEAGESINWIQGFMNLASEEDFYLVVGFLIGALSPRGPYAMLLVNGEQGSAKSTLCRILIELVDPRRGALRSLPRDERDLAIAAHNGWMLAFDNISRVPHGLSDALCRLSTGGGFATRELYSDRDEVIFDAQRPIMLNGIPDLAARPDLGDRAVSVTLAAMRQEDRRPESELWRDFDTARPQILGALFDGVSSALKHVGSIEVEGHERMADFACWVTAAELGLGWEPGSFLAAYRANRTGAIELAVENSPLASAIRDFMAERECWEGSAGELLPELDPLVLEKVRQSRAWPSTPSGLGAGLRRVAAALRQVGVDISIGDRAPTRDRKRLITITCMA